MAVFLAVYLLVCRLKCLGSSNRRRFVWICLKNFLVENWFVGKRLVCLLKLGCFVYLGRLILLLVCLAEKFYYCMLYYSLFSFPSCCLGCWGWCSSLGRALHLPFVFWLLLCGFSPQNIFVPLLGTWIFFGLAWLYCVNTKYISLGYTKYSMN